MTENKSYDEGVAWGKVLEEIRSHGQRLDRVNGSQEHTAQELVDIRRFLTEIRHDLSTLATLTDSRQETVKITAEALEKAEAARATVLANAKAESDRKWTPLTRLYVSLGIIVLVVGLLAAFGIIQTP
jgi:hypothetical protein